MTQKHTPQEQQIKELGEFIFHRCDCITSGESEAIARDILNSRFGTQPLAIKPLEFKRVYPMATGHERYEAESPLGKFAYGECYYLPERVTKWSIEGLKAYGRFETGAEAEAALQTHHRELVMKCLVPGDDKLIYVGLAENAVDAHKFFSPAPFTGGKGWSEEEIAGFVEWLIACKYQWDVSRWKIELVPNFVKYYSTAELFTEYQRHLKEKKYGE